MVRFLLGCIAFLAVHHCYSQPAPGSDTSLVRYELDIGFGSYYQFSSFGRTDLNEVSFPAGIGRRLENDEVRNNWGLNGNAVTDNPFFHGAYFLKMGGHVKIGEDFSVTAAVIGEQRGFSDGVFSERTRNMYTYLNALYTKSYGKFSYFIQTGDFWNFKLYEGLTFDNLETQSWIFKLKYGKFYVKHAGIGDLLLGIGLGIDDLYDYSLGFEALSVGSSDHHLLDVIFGVSNNRGSQGGAFTNASARLTMPNDLVVYAQLSNSYYDAGSAYLVGSRIRNLAFGAFTVEAGMEIRRYGAAFNRGYSNTVYYRDPQDGSNFVNSSNNVFVPVDFFERNFNQWAVYTEYQNRDVVGLTGQIDAKYNWFRNSFLVAEFDLSYLSDGSEGFTYAFYNLGYAVEPAQGLEISLTLTNRVINLDKNYPTLYQSSQSYFLLRMFRPLQSIRSRNALHRF